MVLPASPHLLFALLLCVIALVVADHLWRAWRIRRQRRRRLMARIDQLRREASAHREATGRHPRMSTRGRA